MPVLTGAVMRVLCSNRKRQRSKNYIYSQLAGLNVKLKKRLWLNRKVTTEVSFFKKKLSNVTFSREHSCRASAAASACHANHSMRLSPLPSFYRIGLNLDKNGRGASVKQTRKVINRKWNINVYC